MDFNHYGIQEWAKTRPEQLAQFNLDAAADAHLLSTYLKKLVGWLKRRRSANPGPELLPANQV